MPWLGWNPDDAPALFVIHSCDEYDKLDQINQSCSINNLQEKFHAQNHEQLDKTKYVIIDFRTPASNH